MATRTRDTVSGLPPSRTLNLARSGWTISLVHAVALMMYVNYVDGYRHMRSSQCLQIDVMAVHFYDTDPQHLISFVQHWHSKYGKPVALTEFACQNFGGGAQANMDQVWGFYKTVMPFLTSQDWMEGVFPFGTCGDCIMCRTLLTSRPSRRLLGEHGQRQPRQPAHARRTTHRPRRLHRRRKLVNIKDYQHSHVKYIPCFFSSCWPGDDCCWATAAFFTLHEGPAVISHLVPRSLGFSVVDLAVMLADVVIARYPYWSRWLTVFTLFMFLSTLCSLTHAERMDHTVSLSSRSGPVPHVRREKPMAARFGGSSRRFAISPVPSLFSSFTTHSPSGHHVRSFHPSAPSHVPFF